MEDLVNDKMKQLKTFRQKSYPDRNRKRDKEATAIVTGRVEALNDELYALATAKQQTRRDKRQPADQSNDTALESDDHVACLFRHAEEAEHGRAVDQE